MLSDPEKKFMTMPDKVFRGGVTNDVMCAAVELVLQADDGKGDTEKVDRIASPRQPPEKVQGEIA